MYLENIVIEVSHDECDTICNRRYGEMSVLNLDDVHAQNVSPRCLLGASLVSVKQQTRTVRCECAISLRNAGNARQYHRT